MLALNVNVFALVVLLCWSCSAEDPGCGAGSCDLELDEPVSLLQSKLKAVKKRAPVAVEGPDAMEVMQKASPHNRHLATIRPPQPMKLSRGNITLNFQSAVPTFGAGGNYIALLHKYDEQLWHALKDYKLFCSGPGESHRVPMRILGGETDALYKTHLIWHCDWPQEEAHAGSYMVFLQEADGTGIGALDTSYDPKLLKKYNTVACVTSVWPGAHSLSWLPQWLEYNLIHGVDHFLVYTMTGTAEKVMDIYRQYLNDGVATRVHLEIPDRLSGEYKAVGYSTQAWLANDCLYRIKNHAKWMSPTMDIDEYFRLTQSTQVQTQDASQKTWDGPKTSKEINSGASPWDVIMSNWKDNTNRSNAHSLSFARYTFLPAQATDALQISSSMREERLNIWNGTQMCPKYVVNPALVNALFIHWPTSWVAGTVALGVPHHLGVANHYRASPNSSTATVKDLALVAEVPALIEAVEARFKSKWESLVTELDSANSMTSLQQMQRAALQIELSRKFRAWIDDFSKLDQIEIIVPPSLGSSRS